MVRDPARVPSNWRSRRPLDAALAEQGVVGISGVDTRSLTRHIRERGAMRGGVFSGDALADADALVDRVLASPRMAGADLAGEVTTDASYVVPAAGERRFRVAALDLGIKTNTPRMMAARGIETHVLPVEPPRSTTCSRSSRTACSSPTARATRPPPTGPVALTRAVLERRIPLFGICFGHQILGRALGRGTYKLRYGHRGINIPVIDVATGRVAITAQNHGFALEGEPGERFDTPFGARADQPLLPERRLRGGRARAGRAGVLGAVPPGGGGRPARRRPAVRRVRRPDGGETCLSATTSSTSW